MPYTFQTFAQAKAALAARLYNSTETFFADAELGAYVLEALQFFNACANFYRNEFTFPGRQNVTWYDLTDTTNLPNTLRPLTTTDQSLIELIEYHFLEPQTSTYPLTWTGSKQFAISDILSAIQQVRDELLSDTNCAITESLVSATAGRIFLPGNALNIRRVCWIPVSGFGYTPNCLVPSDIWSDQSFDAGFPQLPAGYPQNYRRSTEPPLSFDVDIQPAVPGQYDVLTVNAGAALSTTASTILPVPNDWCSIIKWGAIAQLLGRDSAAHDTLRANYALGRYKQGVAAIQSTPALLAARINNVPVVVETLQNADWYAANWQAQAAGSPVNVWYAGLNMLALNPVPSANNAFSVTATVLQNMVLPTLNTDFLQVGQDDMGAILDYAQHIALFKSGGAEFAQTIPLYNNFMRHCGLYNSKLKGLSNYLEMIDGRGRDDERLHATFTKPTPAEVSK